MFTAPTSVAAMILHFLPTGISGMVRVILNFDDYKTLWNVYLNSLRNWVICSLRIRYKNDKKMKTIKRRSKNRTFVSDGRTGTNGRPKGWRTTRRKQDTHVGRPKENGRTSERIGRLSRTHINPTGRPKNSMTTSQFSDDDRTHSPSDDKNISDVRTTTLLVFGHWVRTMNISSDVRQHQRLADSSSTFYPLEALMKPIFDLFQIQTSLNKRGTFAHFIYKI